MEYIGEASNLRHAPEFLCFLFHKMSLEVEERSRSNIIPSQPQVCQML